MYKYDVIHYAPEGHHISQRHEAHNQIRFHAQKLVNIGGVVPEISSRADSQTRHNTPSPSQSC